MFLVCSLVPFLFQILPAILLYFFTIWCEKEKKRNQIQPHKKQIFFCVFLASIEIIGSLWQRNCEQTIIMKSANCKGNCYKKKFGKKASCSMI